LSGIPRGYRTCNSVIVNTEVRISAYNEQFTLDIL